MNRRKLLAYGAFGLSATAFAPVDSTSRSRAASQSVLNDIEQIVIHPAIGIARVGNSPDGWFMGPEVSGPHPVPADGFKDAAGRIKRQAARFRLYGLDRDGRAIAEVTAEDADVRWTVHLANTKAAWYTFDIALDIPEARGLPPAPLQAAPAPTRSMRRSAAIPERAGLRIDPGARSVGGRNANADGSDASARFAGGTFLGKEVPLGELRTDDAGRLLVFGGMGISGEAVPGELAVTFANNDLWWDDTSDGPVDATVRIGDREIPITGAWVVVAPPNYAPGIQSVVTMDDVMFEVATILESERRPSRPSFTRMVYPLFARMVQNQWVNAGFLRNFGWVPQVTSSRKTLRMLSSPSAIEATADGWWYAALLPAGRLAVAWFTDPDLLARDRVWRPERWWNVLRAGELVRELVARSGCPRLGRVYIKAAGSTLLPRPTAKGWVAAGDAAAAFDPLSSHGIGSAVTWGKQAADAVAAALDGDDTVFSRYTDRLRADYTRYLWLRHAYYAEEQRWPGYPFWSRRHAVFGTRTSRGPGAKNFAW